MTDDNTALRLMSPVLSFMPWHTTVLQSTDLTKLEGMVSFEKFLDHLRQYESRLFSLGGCSESLMTMQCLLGLNMNSTKISSLEVVGKPVDLLKLNPRDGTKLCGLICAYRLLDVIALLGGHTPRSPHVPHRLPDEDITLVWGMDQLVNWPGLLIEFRKTMRKGNVPPDVNRLSDASHSAPFRLLRLVAYNEWSKVYKRIEGNFLAAAVHVACMKEFEFRHDSYPDIPETLEEMVNGTCDNPLPLSEQEKEDLEELSLLSQVVAQTMRGSERLMFLRSPLQLSLLISPIYLICGVQLSRKTYNRRTMLLINQLLGNEKTDLIIEVEKAIWRVVFSLAEGCLDPAQLLHRLCEDLPWAKITAAKDSLEDRLWFDLGRCVPDYESAPAQIIGSPDVAAQLDGPECGSLPPTSPKAMMDVSLPQSNAMAGQATMDVCQDNAGFDDLRSPSSTTHPSSSPTAYGGDCPMLSDEDIHDMLDNGHRINHCPDPDPVTEGPTAGKATEGVHAGESIDEEMNGVKECTAVGHVEDENMDDVEDETKESEATEQGADDDEGCRHGIGGRSQDEDNGSSKPYHSMLSNSATSFGRIEAQRRKPTALPEKQTLSGGRKLRQKRKAVSTPDVESEGGEKQMHSDRRKLQQKRKAVSTSDVESEGGEDDVPLSVKPVGVQITSIWEPETITEFTELEKISLIADQSPAKVPCDSMLEAFDTQGQKHSFRPQFHYGDYNDRLKQFFERIESGYENNQPLHIASPTRSGFEIVPLATFKSMPPEELHRLHRHKNIVVTGCPFPDLKFDEDGLRTLAPLDSQISILDYTYPATKKGQNTMPITVSGIFRDVLDNANQPNGKILNALDLPLWDNNLKERLPYATDIVAWDYVRGRPHCGNSQYPTTHMRWGLAGTANTLSFTHIDSDGYSTFVRVIRGKKVWGIYRQPSQPPLSSINFFLDKNFRLDEILDQSTFGLEAIVLRPGDMLLMQPGIPHFVYGPEKTICYGGHYYSTCLMQATLRSLIHSFVVDDFITNTGHVPSRALLRRIVHLYGLGFLEKRLKKTDVEYRHLPDTTTFNGLLDLLSACTLAILGNVLDPRTYSAPNQREGEEMSDAQKIFMVKYDRNNIPSNERKAICYARGVALNILRWIRSEFVITSPDGHIVDDLPSRFLVQILKALITYKAQAMRSTLKGAPHCDTASLKKQVTNVVRCDPLVEKVWNNSESISGNSLEFEGKDGYSVERKDHEATDPFGPNLYWLMGLTAFDVSFMQGEVEMKGRIEAEARSFKMSRNA